MTRRLRVGVVGLGYWGPKLAHNFHQNPDFELVALCDEAPVKLAQAGEVYPGLLLYASVRDMLARSALDLVAVVTPVSSQRAIALCALRAGCHVLVEKPFARSLAEADELLNVAREKRRLIFVDHTFTYTGAVREIARQYRSGALGELLHVDSVRINLGRFRHDVDVIWDLAPHDLSILKFVVNSEVRSVQVNSACHNPAGLADIAYLHLEYENGLTAHLHLSWRSPVKVRRMIFSGTRAAIVFDDMLSSEKVRIYEQDIRFSDANSAHPQKRVAHYEPGQTWAPDIAQQEALATEIKEIARRLAGRRATVASGADGRQVVAVLEACERSMKAGCKPVPIWHSEEPVGAGQEIEPAMDALGA